VCARATKKRLDGRGNYIWRELLASVLDGEHHPLGVKAGRDPHGALFRRLWTIALCTRLVLTCSIEAAAGNGTWSLYVAQQSQPVATGGK
jgi:hypothetical protein